MRFISLSEPKILRGNYLPAVHEAHNFQPEEINDIVRIIATGRSDYPNQINNVLAFPGIFRGALDSRAIDINEPMKLAAAHAIAECIDENDLGTEYIVPSVFNKKVVRMVARAVKKAAYESGVAERKKAPFGGETGF